MKVQFKYKRMIDKELFKPGVHKVGKDILSHWYFKSLVKAGDVIAVADFSEDAELSEKIKPIKRAGRPGKKKAELVDSESASPSETA